jgi:hypothetical protein
LKEEALTRISREEWKMNETARIRSGAIDIDLGLSLSMFRPLK